MVFFSAYEQLNNACCILLSESLCLSLSSFFTRSFLSIPHVAVSPRLILIERDQFEYLTWMLDTLYTCIWDTYTHAMYKPPSLHMCSLYHPVKHPLPGGSRPHWLAQFTWFFFSLNFFFSFPSIYICMFSSPTYDIHFLFSLPHTQVPSLLNGLLWLACANFSYTVTAWVVSVWRDGYLPFHTSIISLSLSPSNAYTTILTREMIRV